MESQQNLAGEWVQVVRMEMRTLVFYCNNLVRKLDPSGSLENTENVKDV